MQVSSSRVDRKFETLARDFPSEASDFMKKVMQAVKDGEQLPESEVCPKEFITALPMLYKKMNVEEKSTFKHCFVWILHAIALCSFMAIVEDEDVSILISLLELLQEIEPNFLKLYYCVKIALESGSSAQTPISELIDSKEGVWATWGNRDVRKYSAMIPGFANSKMCAILQAKYIEEWDIMRNIKESLLEIVKIDNSVTPRERKTVNPSDVLAAWRRRDDIASGRRFKGILKHDPINGNEGFRLTLRSSRSKYQSGLAKIREIADRTRSEDINGLVDVIHELIVVWIADDGGEPFQNPEFDAPVSYETYPDGDNARSKVYVVTMIEILNSLWKDGKYHGIQEVKDRWFSLFKVRESSDDWEDIFEAVVERACMYYNTVGLPKNLVVPYSAAYLIFITQILGRANLFADMVAGISTGKLAPLSKFERSLAGCGPESCEMMFRWLKGEEIPSEWEARLKRVFPSNHE